MDREEYIQRATESFNRYIEAFRNYDDSEVDAYGRLMVLQGRLLESLEGEYFILGVKFKPAESDDDFDDGLDDFDDLTDLLELPTFPDSEDN